jgi:DNA-directed RNA polymerase sigma subunit (sigma70/sigma32)
MADLRERLTPQVDETTGKYGIQGIAPAELESVRAKIHALVEKKLGVLSNLEQMILKYRMGLQYGYQFSLADTAKILSVEFNHTKSSIHAIERQALQKLMNVKTMRDLSSLVAELGLEDFNDEDDVE